MARFGRTFPIRAHINQGAFRFTQAGAVAESVTASDTQTAQADFVSTITETLAPAETQAATAVFAAAITEAVTAAETSDATISQEVAATETLSLADSQSATVDFAAAVVESVTVVDVTDASGGGAASGYPFEPDSTAIPYFPRIRSDYREQDDEQVLQVVSAVVLALF